MVCALPAPRWQNRAGLTSATENIADQSIVLTYGNATSSFPVYYTIYASFDFNTLLERPAFVSSNVNAILPSMVAEIGMFFAVRASHRGMSKTLNAVNLLSVDGTDNLLYIPQPTTLRANLNPSDGYVLVDNMLGFPLTDGYIMVGDEVIGYDSLAVVSGGPAFHISNRDPFACNSVAVHLDGYGVSIFVGFENKETPNIKATISSGLKRPTWNTIDKVGLLSLEDLGNGSNLIASWDDAREPIGFSKLYYVVYRSLRIAQLYNSPLGITSSTSALISDVRPGDGYYYGVRAAYFINNLPTSGMNQIGSDFFEYPRDTITTSVLNISQLGGLAVSNTTGYPSSGILRIGSELLMYGSKTSTSFNIVKRDVFQVGAAITYHIGKVVSFFRGVDDGNQYFLRSNTSWDGYGLGALPLEVGDGYWGFEYLQDPDGYRNFAINVLAEDHSIQEIAMEDAPTYDYCGFKNIDLAALYTKNYCGSFAGGFINGTAGGVDVFGVNNQRQELILGITGEPFILLRRKITGRVCSRTSHRNEHPHQRCSVCYGTMFEGGYDRYFNNRRLRPTEANPNGLIQVRVQPYNDQLVLIESGLSQEQTDLEVWTTSLPTIRDRDILIRYNFDITTGALEEEFRYVVIRVNRNKLLLSADGAQKITIKRLNPTDESYKIPVEII